VVKGTIKTSGGLPLAGVVVTTSDGTNAKTGAGTARTRVELQALAHGKWISFKTADLRNGTFKANYRFTRTFFTQRYSFPPSSMRTTTFPTRRGSRPW
jgi:hypothetical protein